MVWNGFSTRGRGRIYKEILRVGAGQYTRFYTRGMVDFRVVEKCVETVENAGGDDFFQLNF